MTVYIKGMGNISPQKTWAEVTLFQEPLTYASNTLSCVEPDYSSFIDAKLIRRMSRIIKMAVASASLAMKEADLSMPDGIITGTGYGCLEDTGTFLTKMIDNKEVALNPTPFIQSTHNTMGSQIALILQCQAYNQTYTHGAFSFESALLDAVMQAADYPSQNFLVGAIDEITPASHAIQSRFGKFRERVDNSLDIFKESKTGALHGEGAAFFVLSGTKDQRAIAGIEGVSTFYKPDESTLRNGVTQFMKHHSLEEKSIDLVLLGTSGYSKDGALENLSTSTFKHASIGVFKHLCGEYPVANSFALWLGSEIIRRKSIPAHVLQRDSKKPVKNILILNQYFGTHYSLIYLRAC
jgi:3-oxoacyl-[acyl-carrier-protein] synthase II